uniref:DDE Tnp4 domain-containing protein n=2 Tax=Clytia hemisphaerica TaxID=252671 RepID=A0A7M6DQ69_9CNID
YKHHNTAKILISVLPNSLISYVSEPYTGRISDKAIVNETEFLDTLPPYCSLMTDKGFNIEQECAQKSIHLIIPPGRRGTSQMTEAQLKKTAHIAKVRILVEQVIRRVKTFQILSNEVQISFLPHLNDIVIVCCALSNLRKPIMK